MLLEKLIQLLLQVKAPQDWYGIYDETGKLLSGIHHSGYQLKYIKGQWHIYLAESSRAGTWADEAYSTLREACIAFLKRSDEYFHLASHILEFKE
ncbi:MAG: hypothetical protein IJ822_01280 [Pyramidobacter sp.]|nr:hypothetical protein [Pyramidobacter sp.]